MGVPPVSPHVGARQLRALLWKAISPVWEKYTYAYTFPTDAQLIEKNDGVVIAVPDSEAEDVAALQPFLKNRKPSSKPLQLVFLIGFRDFNKLRRHMEEVRPHHPTVSTPLTLFLLLCAVW